MIRQPDLTTVAQRLEVLFREAGVPLGHQKSLNEAAALFGYKNWTHAQHEQRKAKQASSQSPASEPPMLVYMTDEAPGEIPKLTTQPKPTATELSDALEVLADRFEAVLGSRPVRDADEQLVYARGLVERSRSMYVGREIPTPTIVSLTELSQALKNTDH
jgi:hypothetical protein